MDIIEDFLKSYERAAKSCQSNSMTQVRIYAYSEAVKEFPQADTFIGAWKKQMSERRSAVSPDEIMGQALATGMGRITKAIKRERSARTLDAPQISSNHDEPAEKWESRRSWAEPEKSNGHHRNSGLEREIEQVLSKLKPGYETSSIMVSNEERISYQTAFTRVARRLKIVDASGSSLIRTWTDNLPEDKFRLHIKRLDQ